MAIDWVRLRMDIVDASVRAVNATLYSGEERALKDVPVRKVFRGGRQTVRFKTAAEIDADKELRSKLGLAPEILATPEALARVRAAGRDPLKSLQTKQGEFGFARTISRPSSDPRRLTRGATDPISGLRSADNVSDFIDRSDFRRHLQSHGTGLTRAQRGLTENRPNKANTFQPGNVRGDDAFIDRRVLNPSDERHLADENAERLLTSRGRRELATGRAIFQRRKEIATVEIKAGKVTVTGTEFVSVGPARLGGGLRGTIRVVKANRASYPVIEGWLVAGDQEHDYAIHQELGNRHNPAHPFLRPRLPEWKEELPAQLRRSLARTGR